MISRLPTVTVLPKVMMPVPVASVVFSVWIAP
jgi:hypothetical protein